MRFAAEYAVVSLLVVAVTVGILYPALGPRAGPGIAFAGAVAYPVMAGSFALMLRFRGAGNRFLAVWIGGTLVRLLVLGLTVVAVLTVEALRPAATLLALAGFFFTLLLLEPVFFRRAVGAGRPDPG